MDEPPFWTELSLRVRPEASESLAEMLQELTGSGVVIEPAIEALGPDEGFVLDVDAPVVLRAYVRGVVEPDQRRILARRLRRRGDPDVVIGRVIWRTIREEDWAEAWKAHYDVEHVGRVVIRPAWREYQAREGEVVVSLDPGMAFGTGQHATTRICLVALQELVEEQGTWNREQGERGGRVLDLGCGSGVLAIAAVALGVGSIVAVDVEEQAVAAARSNAALNGMEDRIEVRHGSVGVVADDGSFDLVLANINAATIAALAGDIARLLRPGAALVASGIIEERAEACAAAVEKAGLRIERRLAAGNWRAFVARRSSE